MTQELWSYSITTNSIGLPRLNTRLLDDGSVLAGYHWQGFHRLSPEGSDDESHRKKLKSYDQTVSWSDPQGGVWIVSDDTSSPDTKIKYYNFALAEFQKERTQTFRIESNWYIKAFFRTEEGDWYLLIGEPFWSGGKRDIITKYSPDGQKGPSYTGFNRKNMIRFIRYLDRKIHLITKEEQVFAFSLLETESRTINPSISGTLIPSGLATTMVDFLPSGTGWFFLSDNQVIHQQGETQTYFLLSRNVEGRHLLRSPKGGVLVLAIEPHEPTHTICRMYYFSG